MSLADLQKKPVQRKPTQADTQPFDVDEFIENARSYAKGIDNIRRVELPDIEPLAVKTPSRKATFTLNEASIESLHQLSAQTGLTKSALIRTLIKHLDNVDSIERQLLVCRYKS